MVNIHLSKKPEWFLEKINPLGKVPAIQKDDKVVYESAVCCDYLDQVYPGNKLTPDDPYQQARDRILVEHFGQVCVGVYYKIFNYSVKCYFLEECRQIGELNHSNMGRGLSPLNVSNFRLPHSTIRCCLVHQKIVQRQRKP